MDHAELIKQTGTSYNYTASRLRKDGRTIEVSITLSPVFDNHGKLTAISFITRDITEQKRAEEKIRESEERLAEAQRMAHIGNWVLDVVTGETYGSDEIYRIFGLSPQESTPVYGKLLNYVHSDDRDYVDNAFQKGLKGEPFGIDYRIILDDRRERIVHTQVEVILDEKKNPIMMKGTVQDITELKKSEEKIQNFANIVESSSDAIGTISLDGLILSWNKGAEEVYGYSTEEISRKLVNILAPPHLKDETIRLSDRVKKGEKIRNYETIRQRKDGKMIYVSFSLSPVFDIYGKLIAFSFISRDITKRKEAEEALNNIEILRKQEIHHRIKNNLQVISSLLDLQTGKFIGKKNIKESQVLEAFRESQDRVISMALIHEELYKGGKVDTLNFSHYVKELADILLLTYRVGNNSIILDMRIEEDIFFDMDTAVPLGIIINELLSNSLKHAFSGRANGEIQIKLHREECKSISYILSVSDNGIGIPKYFEIEDFDSLGLQLVTTLVDQLDGEFELKRNNGTEFTMRFTVKENNSSASVPAPQLIE
jgi:PAS domain S-box-containing protein